ncbi:MAG: LTA synthase family protein [Bacteroidota bacterium]
MENRKSYTPFLDSLISVSTYYNNAFANGKSSINGIPAIISSMPTYMEDPYLNSTYSNNTLNGLPLLLKQKGYHTSFFHGATNGSMNFNSYAKSAGYDIYFGRTEYDNDLDYDGQWGIWDEPFLMRMAKEIKTFKEPFFTTVFTLSSHHPYKVPKKYNNKFPKGSLEIHESIGYADYSLRSFFNHIKNSHWFQNTLFVLSADHTAVSEDPFYGNSVGQYSIPIIFYKPGQKGEIINKNIQQIDIMPTILDFLNYDKTYFSFGKSVLAVGNLPIVYYNSPNYNLINDSMVYLFNHFKITEAYNFKADSNLSIPLQGKYLKKELDATNYFKALRQNYNNDVLNNKTFYNN